MRTSAALMSIHALSPALCADWWQLRGAAILAWISGVACANKAAGRGKECKRTELG